MTYREILKEMYDEHKLGLRLYVIVSLFISVFFASRGNYVMAAATAGVASTAGAFGGTFGAIFGPIAESKLSSFDVPIVMSLISIVSIIVQYAPYEFFEKINMVAAKSYSFGILEFWPVRIFCFLWCAVDIISSSGTVSYSVGATLTQIDKILGVVVNIAVIVSQIFTNVPNAIGVNAAEIGVAASSASSGRTGIIILTGVICFFVLIYCGINYVLVSMLCSYIDIMLVPLCSVIPGLSIVVNIIKILGIIAMGIIALFAPVIFIILYFIIFILAIVFFKRAYFAIKYYSNIYTKPMFRKLKGYRKDMPLYAEKLPKSLVEKENLDAGSVAFPVYLLKNIENFGKKHEKCFFIINQKGTYICKPLKGKKDNLRIGVESSFDRRIFIKKSFRYFEIFNMTNGDADMGNSLRNITMDIHFAFSKEYTYRFDEIQSLTGYTDFDEYKKLFLNKKEIRYETN